jgi:hypothetical protein
MDCARWSGSCRVQLTRKVNSRELECMWPDDREGMDAVTFLLGTCLVNPVSKPVQTFVVSQGSYRTIVWEPEFDWIRDCDRVGPARP